MYNPNPSQRLRGFVRQQVLNVLGAWATPVPGIHILNGHRIAHENEPHTFKTLLQELSQKVSFIKIEEAVERIMRKEQPHKPLVAFTFDDGFMECYDIFAPLLEEFGTNALFFVNPNYVDGDASYIENFNNHVVLTEGKTPLRWSHLKELAKRGHIIGAHTMDHYMINTNDEQTLRYQIENCKSVIEQQIQQPCNFFAFPYGRLTHANQLSIDIACNTYKHVFSQSNYKHYFSFNGKVINRRHFEPFWPINHITYFISCNKTYE